MGYTIQSIFFKRLSHVTLILIGQRENMYKKIVVAVDESDSSYLAFEEALNIAHEGNGKLTILHVVEMSLPPVSEMGETWVDIDAYKKNLLENANKLLNKLVAVAHSAGVNVDTQLIVITDFSRVSEKIVEMSTKLAADLLVLGTHGRRGFRRCFIGSVAEEIVRTSHVPVLLIRGKE